MEISLPDRSVPESKVKTVAKETVVAHLLSMANSLESFHGEEDVLKKVIQEFTVT